MGPRRQHRRRIQRILRPDVRPGTTRRNQIAVLIEHNRIRPIHATIVPVDDPGITGTIRTTVDGPTIYRVAMSFGNGARVSTGLSPVFALFHDCTLPS